MTTMFDAGRSSVLLPRTEDEVRLSVLDAIAGNVPIRICGAGTWADAGGPVATHHTLSLHDLSGIMQSLKRHTPSEINKRLGREGSLWQQESFSHIVRIGEQLAKFQRYIAENPAKARLKEGEYLLWKPT